MNKEARKALRQSILAQLDDDMMPLEVGGHTITDQQVYAGCSQWSQEDRHWDETRNAFAYIVDAEFLDGAFQLTFPKLDYFDGHNQIERQTKYYLQPDRSENPPSEPVGEPLRSVPDRILLEIAKGLADALTAHKTRQTAEDQEAIGLVGKLTPCAAKG